MSVERVFTEALQRMTQEAHEKKAPVHGLFVLAAFDVEVSVIVTPMGIKPVLDEIEKEQARD